MRLLRQRACFRSKWSVKGLVVKIRLIHLGLESLFEVRKLFQGNQVETLEDFSITYEHYELLPTLWIIQEMVHCDTLFSNMYNNYFGQNAIRHCPKYQWSTLDEIEQLRQIQYSQY